MFREAVEKAAKFTFPVVISRRAVNGNCSSSVATFMVLNPQGWIITAGHVVRQWAELDAEVQRVRQMPQTRAAIEAATDIDRAEKRRRLAELVVRPENSDRCSAFWNMNGSRLVDMSYISLSMPDFEDVVDIAAGRLEPFDPSWVAEYPVFKNPATGFDPGTSLCKLGFPFHAFAPTYRDSDDMFELPPGAMPMPRFPLEGIFTRSIEIALQPDPGLGFPVRYVETSSPGLKGQSGGPTFDKFGNVWAIQAKTQHLHLGFNPPVPGGKRGQTEHQFLNAGLGVHVDTIFGFLNHLGISYTVSNN